MHRVLWNLVLAQFMVGLSHLAVRESRHVFRGYLLVRVHVRLRSESTLLFLLSFVKLPLGIDLLLKALSPKLLYLIRSGLFLLLRFCIIKEVNILIILLILSIESARHIWIIGQLDRLLEILSALAPRRQYLLMVLLRQLLRLRCHIGLERVRHDQLLQMLILVPAVVFWHQFLQGLVPFDRWVREPRLVLLRASLYRALVEHSCADSLEMN